MATILQFPTKVDDTELQRLRCKLLELQEAKEAILRELRITRDMIKLLEGGEKR